MKFLKFLVAGLAFLSASAVSATPISMVGTWIGHRGGTGTVEFVIDDTVFQTASPNAVNWFDPMVASNFFFSGQLWNGASFYEAYDPEPGIWHLTFQWTAPIDPYIDLMSQPQMLAFTLNSYTSSKYDYLKTEVWVSG